MTTICKTYCDMCGHEFPSENMRDVCFRRLSTNKQWYSWEHTADTCPTCYTNVKAMLKVVEPGDKKKKR